MLTFVGSLIEELQLLSLSEACGVSKRELSYQAYSVVIILRLSLLLAGLKLIGSSRGPTRMVVRHHPVDNLRKPASRSAIARHTIGRISERQYERHPKNKIKKISKPEGLEMGSEPRPLLSTIGCIRFRD